MSKFLLVDHSIIGVGGHYLEYANNVLKAAKAREMDIFLATNKSFQKNKCLEEDDLTIYPCFKYDVWGKKAQSKRKSFINLKPLKRKCKMQIGRMSCLIKYSPLNYARKGMGSGDLFLNGELASPISTVLKIVLLGIPSTIAYIVFHVIKKIIILAKRISTFILNKILWLVGLNTHQAEQLKEIIKHPICRIKGIEKSLRLKRQISSFERKLVFLINKIKLQAGDSIFIPTLSESDLKAVLDVILAGKDNGCSWHIVMRRNVFEGREPDYMNQMRGQNSLRNTLQAFSAYDNVYFYTDTEELTKQYDLLSEIDFYTLPIPINELFYERNKMGLNTKYKIVYIGDARSEKGYQYLPQIIEELFERYKCKSRICFDLQSNFTFKNYSDDIDVVLARKKLQEYNSDSVNLRFSAMKSKEYVDFIKNADLGLLLYDRNNYYARSSGALVEFLASGIPVVVLSGSWLSTQIEYTIRNYQLKLKENADIVGAFYMDSKKYKWRKTEDHNAFVVSSKRKVINTDIPLEYGNIDGVFLEYNLSELTKDGVYVRTVIEQYDEHQRMIQKKGYDYKKGEQEKQICYYEIKKGATRIKFIIYCPFGEINAICSGATLYFSRGLINKPCSVVGICCTEIDEVTEAIMEITSNLKHYKDSALKFSVEWNKKHSVHQLVDTLIKNVS